ncbi:hypothetical protein D3C86_1950030 [compost metagenome]
MPAPDVGQVKSYRNSQYLTGCKSHLHETHYASALVNGKKIGDDGHRNRSNDSTEKTGNDSRAKQHFISGRHGTAQSSDNKSGVKKQ